MRLKQITSKLVFAVAGFLAAGSAMATSTYEFRIYSPGLTASAVTSAAPVSDPYWSSVVSLLHMDGPNGSSTFTDRAGNALTVSGATLSTATSALGGSSASLNGSSFVQAAASNKFNLTGDFTIEGFTNFSAISTATGGYSPTNQYIFDIGANGTVFRWYATTGWNFFGGGVYIVSYNGATPATNHWYYWVIQRKGSTVSMFLDGSLVATGTYSGALGGSTTLTVGDYGDGSLYGVQGYVDEVRVTNGVARYTTSAPIPTTEFPNN